MLWVCLVSGESAPDQGFSCRIGLNGGNCPTLVGVGTCNASGELSDPQLFRCSGFG